MPDEMLDSDIMALVQIRGILLPLNKAAALRALEWMIEWNKNRPAPEA